MNQNITLKQTKEFKKQTNSNASVRLARNAAMRGEIEDLAMDWEAFRRIDHTFSDMVSGEMPVTNQKSSGRCWGFAGLNLFRIYLGRKYNLKKFEFSQSYFMFWDKFEKSNYFLENIIDTRLTGVLPQQNQVQLEREFAQHSRLSRVKPRSAIGWNNPIGFVVPTYLIRT